MDKPSKAVKVKLTKKPKALLLSGGPAHNYEKTSEVLARVLNEAGIDADIREDFTLVEARALDDYDLIVMNCARWTCKETLTWQAEWGFELSEPARAALLDFFDQGKGLLALHSATICFDDWPEFRNILGAWWQWGHSSHAPMRNFKVTVHTGAHPILEDIADFSIDDELYTDPRIVDTLDPLMEAEWDGRSHPLMWVRDYDGAPICYIALGHDMPTFVNPRFQTLIQRAALWAAGCL